MAKNRRNHFSTAKTAREVLVSALQRRAITLTQDKQHTLGIWAPAKKRHGTGAMKALCRDCGAMVIVTPQMTGVLGGHKTAPGIKGDALFEMCSLQGELM